MATKQLCISADSHVVESADFFKPLVKRFGDEAPRVVIADPDRGPQLDLGNGQLGLGISGFFMANVDFTTPEALELRKKGYELARPGVYDVSERLKDQDLDGIDAEVLYPSVLFNVYQIKNLEILKAAFAAYNDWTADYCKEAPDRLFPLACLQLYDLDDAIAEMERAKKLGHVGVCIPATAPPDRLYSDRWYDKFWDAAQAMQMPLTMHIFTGATPNHGLPFGQAGSPLAFAGVMFTIADLIQSGVCERYPGLKFVITEFETGWTAIMLKRLDWNYIRGGGAKTFGNPDEAERVLEAQLLRHLRGRSDRHPDARLHRHQYPALGQRLSPRRLDLPAFAAGPERDSAGLHAGRALRDDGEERRGAL